MQQNPKQPQLVVVMGVSGCGKSTIARALAEHCNLRYLDADDYHSDEARSRMSRGIPLDDQIRAPWIETICDQLRPLARHGQSCTLAFSGLKKAYREPLRHIGFDTTFLFLDGDKDTIRERIKNRKGHFMPAELLDSQYESLEPPVNEPDAFQLDVRLPVAAIVERAIKLLQRKR